MADAPLALEQYAALRAEIDAGEDMLGVIDREKVTESTWVSAQAFWLKKMAEEAETKRFESTNRYQAIYVAKKKVFESKRARRKTKEAQPPVQEPAVGALDGAAKFLVAGALTEVPAIAVPKAPVVAQIVEAPTFELPPPPVPPPAPVVAPPPRVGPSGPASSSVDHTAPMTGAPTSSGLPFMPAPGAAPPAFVGRPAFVPAPARASDDDGREPDTVRPAGDGRTMAVDIDALLREVKAGGTPFGPASSPASQAPPKPTGTPSTPPANPNFLSTAAVDLATLTASKNAATPFASAPASTPPSAPARAHATPFAKAPDKRPAAIPAARPLEALESDDDDDAPRTMMLTEEAAKLLSKDIPMSARSAVAAVAAAPAGASRASPSRPGDASAEATLAPETAVPALRDPGAGLPFQRGQTSAQPSAEAQMRQTRSGMPVPTSPSPGGALTPPQIPAAPAAPLGAAGGKIFSLNQFASLTAEIAVYADRTAEIRQRYGVTEALHLAESKRWTEEFATNTELRQRYFGLVQTYREYLQKQKG